MDASARICVTQKHHCLKELFLLFTAVLASVFRCVAGIPHWTGIYSPAEIFIKHLHSLLPNSLAQAPGKQYPASFLTSRDSLHLKFMAAVLIEMEMAMLPGFKDIFPLLLAY